jgi:hypothetical protein
VSEGAVRVMCGRVVLVSRRSESDTRMSSRADALCEAALGKWVRMPSFREHSESPTLE